ncbi:MAG: hypothetical protein AAFY81_11095 [Pseudomonadota bacterium]
MQLRPELVLLQKTMVQVEGVARGIDPSHDIWAAAEPIVKDWISQNLGPTGAPKFIAQNVKDVTDRLKRLPAIMDQFEAKLNAPEPTPAPRERFAPWWGWLGFIVSLGLIIVALAYSG